jgi:hypothetical protein
MGARLRVGYATLGRAMQLSQDKWGFVGGDDEPPNLLNDLARRNPDCDFVILGRTPSVDPQELGMEPNISNPWIELNPILLAETRKRKLTGLLTLEQKWDLVKMQDEYTLPLFDGLDALIIWVGQHGTSNSPLPGIQGGYKGWSDCTDPQQSYLKYAGYIIRGTNFWRRKDPLHLEEIYLMADGRNYNKFRDIKWPCKHPVIAQYATRRNTKHERYRDARLPEECGFGDIAKQDSMPFIWTATQDYKYSRLEICGIMPWHIDSTYSEDFERDTFGLFINEARKDVVHNRKDALRDYALPLNPDFIHGVWSEASQKELGIAITPAPTEDYYPLIRSVRCTLTTPSSGTGWATTKPWQAFAVGTVCFFHPEYDTQNHILADAHPTLGKWLRVTSPEQLQKRVEQLNTDEKTWRWIVREQRSHYDKAVEEAKHLTEIEARIRINQ